MQSHSQSAACVTMASFPAQCHSHHLHQQASSSQPRSITLSLHSGSILSWYNRLPLLNATNHPGRDPIILDAASFVDWLVNELLRSVQRKGSLSA